MTVSVPPSAARAAKLSAARAAKLAAKAAPPAVDESFITQKPLDQTRQQQQQQQQEQVEDGDRSSTVKKQQRWYMGQYGEKDDDDHERLSLVQKTKSGKWIVDESVHVKQVNDDVVKFALHSPLHRFIVLRTSASVPVKTVNSFADNIEYLLERRAVVSLIRQRWDHPRSVVHLLVPPSRLDRVISRLADAGYDEGPEPSKEFLTSEGGRLELSFHGNVRRDDQQQSTPLVFHFHGDIESYFQLSPVDKFLQRQLNSYRGVIDIYQVMQNSETDSGGEPSKCIRKLVASHHVNIPKDAYMQMSDDSVFCEPSSPFLTTSSVRMPVTATAGEVAVLRYVAGSVGDEWPVVARCLRLRAAGVHSARRRAELQGFDDEQTRLEILSSWFRAQPRSANKIDELRNALMRSGRVDLAEQLEMLTNEAG